MPRLSDPKQYVCSRRLEAQAARRGFRFIAGCDEAGRGALLGPLYAAAVILDPVHPIQGLDDSKKLSPAVRADLACEIRRHALGFQIIAISVSEVDRRNVYQASRVAMARALRALTPEPDFVLTDAMRLHGWGDEFDSQLPYRALIHGDARSVSIAAASILAKVARDEHLLELDRHYPQYGLASNKGYCTPDHLAGLERYGPCPEHRKTFQPVRDCQLPLFSESGQNT